MAPLSLGKHTGELRLEDRLLAPFDSISMSYAGPDPLKLLNTTEKILKEDLGVGTPSTFKPLLKWDATDGSFYREIIVEKSLGGVIKSSIVIKAEIEGKVDFNTGNGSATITLYGWLITTAKYYNPLQKALYELYCSTWYNHERTRYLKYGQRVIEKIKRHLMEIAGIVPPKE